MFASSHCHYIDIYAFLFYFLFLFVQGGYPARLKKVLIVTAPLWFKAPFKILRLFVREKLRERVFTVSVPQLSLHVPRENLPVHLGGSLQINHSIWLLNCCKSMTNREDDIDIQLPSDLQPQQLQQEHTTTIDNENAAGSMAKYSTNENDSDIQPSSELVSIGDDDKQLNNQNSTHSNQIGHDNDGSGGHNEGVLAVSNGDQLNEMWTENPPSSASSGFSDDDSLACTEGDPKTIEQIVQMVRERGRDGLAKEYSDIRSRAPDGTFSHARIRTNLPKNRYTDVLCYDHSRVILSQENEEPASDYINANFVDGYKQKNAYISTQGIPSSYFFDLRLVKKNLAKERTNTNGYTRYTHGL